MNPSACQREDGVSCGACCGIFNLDFRDPGDRARLLRERTRDFEAVRFEDPASFVAYRARREELENGLPRLNHEIYVCPFFGLLDRRGGRTGCLAHPARTGLAHTQNFSFYGASICQAYDCRNKDQDHQQHYSRLLAHCFGAQRAAESGASEIYARLMADVPLYAFLERFPGLFEILFEQSARFDASEWSRRGLSEGATDADLESPLRDFVRLVRLRLATADSRHISSFEVGMERHADPARELEALLAGAPGPTGDVARSVVENLLAATGASRASK